MDLEGFCAAKHLIGEEVSALPVVCQLKTVKSIVSEDSRDFVEVVDFLLPSIEVFIADFF